MHNISHSRAAFCRRLALHRNYIPPSNVTRLPYSCAKLCVRKEKGFTTLACCVLYSVADREVTNALYHGCTSDYPRLLGVVSLYTLGGFVHPLLVYLWFRSSTNHCVELRFQRHLVD
jgi:hypothetical protein